MSERSVLFAYGTLRAGAGHPMHDVLAAAAVPLGMGWVHGTLLLVEDYPGLVDAASGCGRVRGDLWAIRDPRVWDALDAYEGAEYRCAELTAELDSGGSQRVWVYLFEGDRVGLQVLQSGDWLTP